MGLDPLSYRQGFLTDTGEFVGRKAAVYIARDSGQLGTIDLPEELQSHHIW